MMPSATTSTGTPACAASTQPTLSRNTAILSCALALSALALSSGCKASATSDPAKPPFMSKVAAPPPQIAPDAPPPDQTGGVDGKR